MPTIDFETGIADFLALGRRLQQNQSLTGERILSEVTAWYRDSRINGAAVDRDDDMLLFQWGATRPLLVSEPTDLRQVRDGDFKFADHDVRYLDFTRQVFAHGENMDDDFDDSAVQMSITLGFDVADGDEPSSNLLVDTPEGIDRGKEDFCTIPFVHSLLRVPPRSVAITVGYCG